MHNLQLSEDQELIVETVRKFVADVVAPNAQELDEHRSFVRAQFDALAELGMFGLCVDEQHGGAGMGFLPLVAALEAVGAHSSSLARLWLGQTQAALALQAVGAASLAAAIGGAELFVYVGAEHGLTFDGGRLAGTARLVAGASEAQRLLVAACEGGAPVLLAVDAGAVAASPRRALGLASAGCGAIVFDGATAQSLASGAAAAMAITRAQLVGFLGVAATAVGGGLSSIDAARKHAGERIAFGKPLLVQQAVQRKLVDTRRAVEAARHLTWHAARVADLQQDAEAAALGARIAAVDAMVAAADEAIQIHGGFGYTVEYHVERHYRDAKTLDVLDGGNEALRLRLASLQFA